MDAPQWFLDALATLPEHAETESRRRHDPLPALGFDRAARPRPRPRRRRALGMVGPHRAAARGRVLRRRARSLGPRRQRPPGPLRHGDLGARSDRGCRARLPARTADHRRAQHGRMGRSHGGGRPRRRSRRPDPARLDGAAGRPRSRSGPRRCRVRSAAHVYPTLDAALARFRTVPDQPTTLPYVKDHVARESLREVAGGWTWKFDPRIFERRAVPHGDLAAAHPVPCLAVPCRARPGVASTSARTCTSSSAGSRPIVEVPLAWHHIMLDQPIPLVTGLRALLADWEHSTPQRREQPE